MDCFKFEIESLITGRVFSQEHKWHGIRRAAKGEVADIIRRLGTRVTLDQDLNKLESVYGNIETLKTVKKKCAIASRNQQSQLQVLPHD